MYIRRAKAPSLRNSLLCLPIVWRLVLSFLIPALIFVVALVLIAVQSSQLLSQEALFSQVFIRSSTSLTSAKELLSQMDTTMQGTLNDATQQAPSEETLREDFQAVNHLSGQINALLLSETARDALVYHPELATLFTKAGHRLQLEEQYSLTQTTLSHWKTYSTVQSRVLYMLKMKDFSRAQNLESSQAELSFATTISSIQSLSDFNGSLASAVRDATQVEYSSLSLIIKIAAACVLCSLVLVGWLASSTLVRRLSQLRSVVSSVEHGDLSARLVVSGSDEIAKVSAGVNSMLDTLLNAQKLEHMHEELRSQHRDLHSAHLQLHDANARLEALATSDVLTELPNHRALVASMDQELERSCRYNRSCAVLFFDIDHFKALNDGYGHAAGDAVLKEFSQVIRRHLRAIDTVGRWGGEEFVAILPESTTDKALVFAERVRADIEGHTFSVGGGISLTCSLGIACYPLHAQKREELVTMADQAMYAAKRLGRNQIRAINDPAVQALLIEQNQLLGGGRDETALAGVVEALGNLILAHDGATGEHSESISDILLELLKQLGVSSSEAQMIALAGSLHDLGKIAIPTHILCKPGKLTAEEWQIMQTHPAIGAEVISSIPGLRPLVPMIRSHHERWDGCGYPDQLVANAIPFGARAISVVDSYLAMTENRPYQKARSHAEAILELKRCAGAQFDPQIVEAMAQIALSQEGLFLSA